MRKTRKSPPKKFTATNNRYVPQFTTVGDPTLPPDTMMRAAIECLNISPQLSNRELQEVLNDDGYDVSDNYLGTLAWKARVRLGIRRERCA